MGGGPAVTLPGQAPPSIGVGFANFNSTVENRLSAPHERQSVTVDRVLEFRYS
jgi:hypothetical protein